VFANPAHLTLLRLTLIAATITSNDVLVSAITVYERHVAPLLPFPPEAQVCWYEEYLSTVFCSTVTSSDLLCRFRCARSLDERSTHSSRAFHRASRKTCLHFSGTLPSWKLYSRIPWHNHSTMQVLGEFGCVCFSSILNPLSVCFYIILRVSR